MSTYEVRQSQFNEMKNSTICHARSKQIEIWHHFVRQNIQSKKFDFMYCHTSENMDGIY